MASRLKVVTTALLLSAMAGFSAHQARAGVLGLNLRLLMPWANFTSAADSACKRLWVRHARNDPALRCYLTADLARLCSAQERLHLASMFRRYRWDDAMLTANTIIAAVKPLTMPVGTPQQFQQAQQEISSRADSPPEPKTGVSALQEITERRMDNIAKSRPATLDAALDVEPLAYDELLAPLRSIAMAGYMRKGDFGWAPGALVQEAFENVSAGHVCEDQ
jgi:hypothetical protein